jgi:hypothetical protein
MVNHVKHVEDLAISYLNACQSLYLTSFLMNLSEDFIIRMFKMITLVGTFLPPCIGCVGDLAHSTRPVFVDIDAMKQYLETNCRQLRIILTAKKDPTLRKFGFVAVNKNAGMVTPMGTTGSSVNDLEISGMSGTTKLVPDEERIEVDNIQPKFEYCPVGTCISCRTISRFNATLSIPVRFFTIKPVEQCCLVLGPCPRNFEDQPFVSLNKGRTNFSLIIKDKRGNNRSITKSEIEDLNYDSDISEYHTPKQMIDIFASIFKYWKDLGTS